MLRSTLALSVLVALWIPVSASAQEPVPIDEFSVQRFTPAVGNHNYLQVDGARVEGHLSPSVGLTIDYAHEPFVLVRCPAEDDCAFGNTEAKLVESLLAVDLHGAVTLFRRVQVGLTVPLAYSSGESFGYTAPDGSEVLLERESQFGLGDPRLHVKGALYDQGEQGLDLAAAGYVTAPLGQTTAEGGYVGDDNVRFGGHVIGQYTFRGLHAAVNLGGMWRDRAQLFSTEVGPQLTYAAALGYDITPLVTLFGEMVGATTFSGEVDENPLEARLAGRLRYGDFEVTLGGGTGVIRGAGTPLVRVTGQAAWRPERADDDGDGILNSTDSCPAEPEDKDGFEDEDGCPDDDNDEDGFPDAEDPCPNEAEDQDGYKDGDGCPDRDNDGDGVSDGFDSCPNKPEDKDGDRDDDGCPDADTDRDGIPDAEDECPKRAEDTDGFGDLDGCPEEDFDQDGIPDTEDHCPGEPELFNGVRDKDGCPEDDADGDGYADVRDDCPDRAETLQGYQDDDGCPDAEASVEVGDNEIRLVKPLKMKRNRLYPRSRKTLNAVVRVLERRRHWRRLRIEGHTNEGSSAEENRSLSKKRAQAVADYLTAQGISGDRLHVVGLGSDRTEQGDRASRIELHVEETTPGANNSPSNGNATDGDDGSSSSRKDATGSSPSQNSADAGSSGGGGYDFTSEG
jgi:hypothetical protein